MRSRARLRRANRLAQSGSRQGPPRRRWRAYAPPPLTGHASREPESTLPSVTRPLTSEPPTRRRSIRPTLDRVKGACGVASRWPPATPDPTTPSSSRAPLWVRCVGDA